jgi:hypothetical protein
MIRRIVAKAALLLAFCLMDVSDALARWALRRLR